MAHALWQTRIVPLHLGKGQTHLSMKKESGGGEGDGKLGVDAAPYWVERSGPGSGSALGSRPGSVEEPAPGCQEH